jgi:hypothetical protein
MKQLQKYKIVIDDVKLYNCVFLAKDIFLNK